MHVPFYECLFDDPKLFVIQIRGISMKFLPRCYLYFGICPLQHIGSGVRYAIKLRVTSSYQVAFCTYFVLKQEISPFVSVILAEQSIEWVGRIREVAGEPWRVLHVARLAYRASSAQGTLCVYRHSAKRTFVLRSNGPCELWHLVEMDQCESLI